jgi:putative transposase
MSEKFKGLYRNETFRAQWWDYRSEGSYHITICTENRVHYFGEIINEQICLSEIGKLANQFWSEIPNHFPHIQLDEFVIMPNHVHGILIIRDAADDDCRDVAMQHPYNPEQQINDKSKISSSSYFSSIAPKSGSISVVIRSFKSVVSKHAHRINVDFRWQKLFHDRIIRDRDEFLRVKNYIRNNPRNWK